MKIIIPIIVGAIIGYFTNWLAIKMLFRPHNEIRILGFRLPFTPGLIPKERYRMSKSIGKTVGEHLLTPEKIREVLSSKEAKLGFKNWIKTKIKNLQKNSNTGYNVLKELNINDNRKSSNIKYKIIDNILLNLGNNKIRNVILDFIENEIYDKNKDVFIKEIQTKGKNNLKGFLKSKEIESFVNENINEKFKEFKDDNRMLKEIIPNNMVYQIDNIIFENRDRIADNIRSFLHDPNIKKKLEFGIYGLIEENTSKLITTFLSTEIILEKMVQALYNYIDSESSEELLFFFINSSVEKVLDTKLSTISKELKNIYSKDTEKLVINSLIERLSKDENIEKVINLLIDNIKLKDDIIKLNLRNLVNKKIDENLKSIELRESLLKILDIIINNLLEKPIEDLFENIDEVQIDKTITFIEEIIYKYGENTLLELINIFNVSKIVEEQINSFEVEYTEELILDIAERELMAITRLGALLGGIMGLLSPLLQLLG